MHSFEIPDDLITREVLLDELNDEFIKEWGRLAKRSMHSNPFLHPQFILAQARYLSPKDAFSLWVVENSNRELVLLTPARPVSASSHIPFPHLNDHISAYQFQGGMLVDGTATRQAILAYLHFLKSTRFRHGMAMNCVCVDSPYAETLYTSAALTGFQVHLNHVWPRACLKLGEVDRTQLFDTCLSKNRRKSLRRAHSKLQRRGAVEFRVINSANEVPAAVARFLDLEQRGWKRDAGTAMGCDPAHKSFFETFANAMAAEEGILFGELLVGGNVIASTCNLIAGNTLFAFKIGWDSAYGEGSPGAWAEIELANYVATMMPEIELMDSCSASGSYLDHLWPHRLGMGNIVLFQSHRAVLYSGVRKALRSAKRLIWPVLEPTAPEKLN
ncbi:GNAT family N-acetyltransferase [Planctomicrobium sp. SH527]|uniref:GNAT family N-acetyltransferase n=1 Tax=Planctomicrobium sp. SH527 TaxID=3448123 RepID=UPI003F5B48BE